MRPRFVRKEVKSSAEESEFDAVSSDHSVRNNSMQRPVSRRSDELENPARSPRRAPSTTSTNRSNSKFRLLNWRTTPRATDASKELTRQSSTNEEPIVQSKSRFFRKKNKTGTRKRSIEDLNIYGFEDQTAEFEFTNPSSRTFRTKSAGQETIARSTGVTNATESQAAFDKSYKSTDSKQNNELPRALPKSIQALPPLQSSSAQAAKSHYPDTKNRGQETFKRDSEMISQAAKTTTVTRNEEDYRLSTYSLYDENGRKEVERARKIHTPKKRSPDIGTTTTDGRTIGRRAPRPEDMDWFYHL